MKQPKPTAPPSAGGSAAPTDQPTYRSNPEVDGRIDAYIKENPKHWAYIQGMPRERLERTVVLNEVKELDRQQRRREGVLKNLGQKPELKQAFETIVQGVPEDQREALIARLASQAQRTIARGQGVARTEAVGV